MEIVLNGKPQWMDRSATVRELLQSLRLEPVRVAVEVNEDLVPRKSFDDRFLQAGDRVEIVTFVGGG